MPTMIAPAPFFQVQAQSGITYTADAAAVISNVAQNDVGSLRNASCEQVGLGGPVLIGRLIAANMNSVADQQIPLFNGANPFRITKISFKNATVSLTTAQGSIYTAAAKGGTAMTVTPTTTAYSALTAGTIALDLTILPAVLATEFAATTNLFLSLTTAQGAPATADVFVYGEVAQ